MKSAIKLTVVWVLAVTAQGALADSSCPDFLNHEFRKLHSKDSVNLCELYQDKPMVLVNTASHCGYTKQFSGLEELYQAYKDQGVTVVGFASDDFKQEAGSEVEAATICYQNYGVTFTMLAPTSVKGEAANPVFQHLNTATEAPSWNFNKYLITDQGKTIQHFGSKVKPRDSELEAALTNAL